MGKCQICKSEQNCMKLFLHRKYWDAFYKRLELNLDKKKQQGKKLIQSDELFAKYWDNKIS